MGFILDKTSENVVLYPVMIGGVDKGLFTFIAGGFAVMTACACTYSLDFAQGRISRKLTLNGN
eukprot:6271629-Ditylum_brightwellii.AAC.2